MKFYYLAFFLVIVLVSCQKQIVHEPLSRTVYFQSFGKVQLGLSSDLSVDSTMWKGREKDSVAFFTIQLEGLKPNPLVVKTSLVATKIPFLIKYTQLSAQTSALEVVQQFNTVYSDSIILEKNDSKTFKILKAYKVQYPHNYSPIVNALDFKIKNDTLDLSN